MGGGHTLQSYKIPFVPPGLHPRMDFNIYPNIYNDLSHRGMVKHNNENYCSTHEVQRTETTTGYMHKSDV